MYHKPSHVVRFERAFLRCVKMLFVFGSEPSVSMLRCFTDVPIVCFCSLVLTAYCSRNVSTMSTAPQRSFAARNLLGSSESLYGRSSSLTNGGIERRHSRVLMKRALETLHDSDDHSANATLSGMSSQSRGMTSSSDDDDLASPLRAHRPEGSTGPRHTTSGRRSTGLSGLVDRSLNTRRNSILLDQLTSPSAARFDGDGTPAADGKAPRHSLSQNTPVGRASMEVNHSSRRRESLMKISRHLGEESMTSCASASTNNLQRELFTSDIFDDDERAARSVACLPHPPTDESSPPPTITTATSTDWAAILQRCQATKVLIHLDQMVPRDLLDAAPSVGDIQPFGCGITSSFSFYLSSSSTSNDNSQSASGSSQCCSEGCTDAALQGTLDALLGSQ